MRGLSASALVLKRPSSPWLVATAVLVADALTKMAAQSAWSTREVAAGPLTFHLTGNSGLSFSWFASTPALGVTLVLALFALVLFLSLRAQPGWPALGCGLVVGGAMGNAADRIGLASHQVVDFIAVGDLFVCNIADVAITIGVIVLGVHLLRGQSLTR